MTTMAVQTGTRRFGSRFWTGRTDPRSASIMEVLQAVRRFQEADRKMRTRLTAKMRMNDTDLRAVRYMLGQQAKGNTVTAGSLSGHLGITTAATAKLIKRMTDAGHFTSATNPADKRSTHLLVSGAAEKDVEETMTSMHKKMFTTVSHYTEEERGVIARFLGDMDGLMDRSLADEGH